MEPGTLELQIFVSLIVVLATAFVALVCDYLKGNNETLREHNIELRVRKEEQEKYQPLEAVEWLQHLLGATQRNPIRFGGVRPGPQRAAHPAAARHADPAPAVGIRLPLEPDPAPKPAPQAPAKAPSEPAAEEVGGRGRRHGSGIDGTSSLLDTLPKPAWLQKEQEERAAARASRERQEAAAPSPPPPPEAAPAAATDEFSQKAAAQTGRHDPLWTHRGILDRVVAATSASPVGLMAPQSARIEQVVEETESSKLAASCQESSTNRPAIASAASADEPAPLEAALEASCRQPQLISMPVFPELRLPPGFHDRSVFARHMHSSDVLTGVVAAIGINDYAHHSEKIGTAPMAELMRSVEGMIAGLLRANIDFGCRTSEDEFILVFPNETGADAQRRLAAISERLWNFQLRSLTSFSVFFSWGAVEVQGETLADAAASAADRMYQTKRNRKTHAIDAPRRKLAANL